MYFLYNVNIYICVHFVYILQILEYFAITTVVAVCMHGNDESWLVYAIESSIISALFLCHCLAVIDEICETLLDDYISGWCEDVFACCTSHHLWGRQLSTVYFTLWLTKSHHFSAAQTSRKQLFCCWCCIVSSGWNTQLNATNFCRSVYSGMMQQILPTGRHCAHYKFFVLYCIVLMFLCL